MRKPIETILYLYNKVPSRKIWILISLLLLQTFLIVPLFLYERSLQTSLSSYRIKLNDLIMLNTEYKTLREKVSFLESKISNPQAGGITNVINEIASPLGIKNKVKSIKNVTNRQLKEGFSEETADIVIEKITLNELINIYYKIQDMPTILSIKKTNIKKTFESPQLLDLEITLSLYQLKQETKR